MSQGLKVAPYGGIMTVTLDKEIERAQAEEVKITINGKEEVIRFEALRIRGVDNLSTKEIENHVNHYINDDPLQVLKFKLNWINDSCVNIVFFEDENALIALKKLSLSADNLSYDTADNIQERESKPFRPEFREIKPSSSGDDLIKQETLQEDNMIDDSIELYIRQAFQSDRKVKNANAFSRYYLLHGDPERKPRNYRSREPIRRGRSRNKQDDEEDLFKDKLNSTVGVVRPVKIPAIGGDRWKSDKFKDLSKPTVDDDEEDLFPSFVKRDRSKSPSAQRNRSLSPDLMDRDDDRSLFDRIGQVNNRRRAHDLFQ